MTTVDLGYRCRQQFEAFHRRRQRWACLVAHRRAGKTVACVADLVDAALRFNKLPDGRFAYVAPLYVQAKDVAWLYLKRFTAHIPGVKPNESDLFCDLPSGNRVRLYGADNYDRMRGLYFDGLVADEYADWPPAAWPEVIRPALADRRGSATFIGTPKGRNSFFERWQQAGEEPVDWFRAMLKASETGLIGDEELLAARHDMTPEQYEQEWECSFDAAIMGAYFGRELANAEREGRICSVPFQPVLPVYTAWDLGKGSNMAVWVFQVAGRELHVIDCISGHHDDGLPQIVAVLDGKPYADNFAGDWVPHDAKAVEIGTGRTRIETLLGLKRKPRVVPDHTVDDGINAVQVSLPLMYFDADACRYGLEALRNYRSDYDDKKRTFKVTPRHDWTSHYADAARYMAMAWREMVPKIETPKRRAMPGQVPIGPPEEKRGFRITI